MILNVSTLNFSLSFPPTQQQQPLNNGSSMGNLDSATNSSPLIASSDASAAAQAAMNAMRVSMADSMMRSTMNNNNSESIQINQSQNHLHQHTQHSPEAALRIHQAEAILRSQAEAALRLAVSQAAAVAASSSANANNNLNGKIGCLNLWPCGTKPTNGNITSLRKTTTHFCNFTSGSFCWSIALPSIHPSITLVFHLTKNKHTSSFFSQLWSNAHTHTDH